MRADRLVAILMLLQAKGRMTAHNLASELEVSERTVYRDLEALGMAGVPVYSERGPGGGCGLMEGYRTNLTGLTEKEVLALFVSNLAGPLKDLGLGGARDAAMLKLSAALPQRHRQDVERLRTRFHVDTAEWFRPEESMDHLPMLQEAVWNDRRIRFTYRRADGLHVRRFLDPYGLVAKANVWYLVGAVRKEMRVYRVSRMIEAEVTDQPVTRLADFDLTKYWADWCDEFQSGLPQYKVKLRVSPACFNILPRVYGEGIHALLDGAGRPDRHGWLTITLTFESADEACNSVLGLRTWAEVIDPPDLRVRIKAAAAGIAAFYNET